VDQGRRRDRAGGGMSVFSDVVSWLGDPTHWSGAQGVPTRVAEHLGYTGLAVAVAAVVAVPLGALIGHTGRGGFLVVGLANGLRSLPELGLLTLLVLGMGIGLVPVTLALVVLAIPPLLAGTYAGVRNVDRATVDAAKGMGMTGPTVLMRVELPNALPLILGGLRAASLQVLATAAIAAYVSLGGLGRFLIDGLAVSDYPQVVSGAVLIAALALLVERVLATAQRLAVSPGLRPAVNRRTRSTLGAVPQLVGGRR
jgi:osmoprotectant transport system permease protein